MHANKGFLFSVVLWSSSKSITQKEVTLLELIDFPRDEILGKDLKNLRERVSLESFMRNQPCPTIFVL
jgi:hypothetical protein